MNNFIGPEDHSIDQKITLGLSIWLLLAVHFTLDYLTYTYYTDSLLDLRGAGSWLYILNHLFMASIIIFNKRVMNWSWKDLGLGKPVNWWEPLVTTIATLAALLLFSAYLSPEIIEAFGKHRNLSHLTALRGNLPLLIILLIISWISAAFLQELVFRSFLIDSVEILLGRTWWSTAAAVVASALVFGDIHAYQGLTGIIITGFVGLIFSIGYIFNSRRIWPLIAVHGIVDSLALIRFYIGTN